MGSDSDAENVDTAALRNRIMETAPDPPDDRPELSAGEVPGGVLVVHETGGLGWLRTTDAVEAPDWVPEDDRERDP